MKQWLMSSNKLNIALECSLFYQELLLATFDQNLLCGIGTPLEGTSTKLKLLSGCEDHLMDAFDYALSPWYDSLLISANQYYFPRGLD